MSARTMFSAVRMRICTAGGAPEVTLRRSKGEALISALMPENPGRTRKFELSPRGAFTAALTSADAVYGAFLAVSLAVRLAILFRPELAALPLAVWLLCFVRILLGLAHFRLVRRGGLAEVSRGAVAAKRVRFRLESVSALETRQTPLRRYSCKAVIPGAGTVTLLPSADRRTLSMESAALFPHGSAGMRVDTVSAILWWRWWALAAAVSAAVTLRGFFLPVGLTLTVFLVLRAATEAAAGRKACVRLFSDCAEITGVSGLSVTRLRVMRGKVARARITQSVFQLAAGTCSMYIRPAGARRGVRCRHLPLERAQALLRRLG